MPASWASFRLTRRTLLGAAAATGCGLLAPWARAAAGDRTGDLIGEVSYYVTKGDETLLDVARQRNLGVPEISAANPAIDPWVPGAETLITLPTQFILPEAPREGIVVNYGELRLYHFAKGRPVETYAIGVGRDGFELKMGQTRIVRKTERPTWYPTESTLRDKPWVGKVVPPGPDNPLGAYALYLGWPTYLIHGTNLPYGVGRRVSRGCIRMYPEGVERLYPQIAIGTKVTAVDQPVKLGWQGGELYLEAQPDMAQVDELEASQTLSARPPPEDIRGRLLARAGADAPRIDWGVVDAELAARRGVPVQVTRPRAPSAMLAPLAPASRGGGPPLGVAGAVGGRGSESEAHPSRSGLY
jgi:L,D-transpeptidase ErfK/SrfK